MKKILTILPILAATFLLSGCSFSNPVAKKVNDTIANTSFMRSDDGATSWNPKNRISDSKLISGIDVLSMAVNPVDPNIIYVGTPSSGLFMTKDAGETWAQVAFADKAYGLVFDSQNPNVMYGSGVFKGRAKIYKRMQEGEEWKEIYTEPADGTTISTIAIDKFNSQIIFAGTSEGVIIKSTDGGKTWVNLKKADGPITSIGFDNSSSAHIYFCVFQTGVLETRDGGKTIEDITKNIDPIGNTSTIYTLVADPYYPGVAYVGTASGIFRRAADGNWSTENIIESSKSFPIRSIAINPKNSKEIIYSSAKAIYKSIDSGAKWATYQLDTSKEISILKYNTADASKIYAGFRKF